MPRRAALQSQACVNGPKCLISFFGEFGDDTSGDLTGNSGCLEPCTVSEVSSSAFMPSRGKARQVNKIELQKVVFYVAASMQRR